MKTINLRDYYPFYTQDTLLEVSDEVADALNDAERLERNYIRRVYYHKAHYSLDVGNGIETSAIRRHDFTPEEVLELAEQYRLLCRALNSLPEIQGRRIEACYLLGKKHREIAEAEGVSCSSVSGSIKKGLATMRKYMKEK